MDGIATFFLYMKVNIRGYNFDSYNFLPISHFEGANKTYPHSEVITPTYDRRSLLGINRNQFFLN